MAAPFNPPVKGEDFEIWIALKSIANGDYFKVNPQINAGDFKVLTWDQTPGSPTPVETNLATTPQTLKSLKQRVYLNIYKKQCPFKFLLLKVNLIALI